MKKSCLLGIALLAAFYGVSFPQSIQAADAKGDGAASVTARRLFNGKDLTGWHTFLKERGKNVDPKGVFSVANGVIRITGEEWGGLVTEEDFSNYRLTLEYRWLGTRHGSKTKAALDSGILFHSTGVDGGFGGIWMASHEYNLIQGASGDFWTVHPKGADMYLKAEVADEKLDGRYFIWKEGGAKFPFPATVGSADLTLTAAGRTRPVRRSP